MNVKKIGLNSALLFLLFLIPVFAHANPAGIKNFFHLKHNGPKNSRFQNNHPVTKHHPGKHPKPQHEPNPHR